MLHVQLMGHSSQELVHWTELTEDCYCHRLHTHIQFIISAPHHNRSHVPYLTAVLVYVCPLSTGVDSDLLIQTYIIFKTFLVNTVYTLHNGGICMYMCVYMIEDAMLISVEI